MTLKRFSTFMDEKKNPLKQEGFTLKHTEKSEDVESISKKLEVKEEIKTENNTKVDGFVIKFPDNFKPSLSYKILSESKTPTEKIHFIVNTLPNIISVIKYDRKNDIILNELFNSLIKYYSKNENLKKVVENITVEGNNEFVILKNIPTKFYNILKTDTIKILKNK